jgi:hypothetical protein
MIQDEVKRLFWQELHDFQTERAEKIIERLTGVFGSGVTQALKELDIDWREPLRLYLKSTAAIIKKLKERYGDQVTEIVKEYVAEDAQRRGQALLGGGNGTLEDLLKVFGRGGELVRKTESEAVIRRPGCLVSEVARELGVEDVMYCLHCYSDPYYVKGINPKMTCRHNKTAMGGDACCEYVLTADLH